MKNAFIVIGSTGEYSDHTEWAVRVFLSEERAKTFILKVTQEAALILHCEGPKDPTDYFGEDSEYRYEAIKNKLDPNMRVDYTGVRYYYEKAPFDDKE